VSPRAHSGPRTATSGALPLGRVLPVGRWRGMIHGGAETDQHDPRQESQGRCDTAAQDSERFHRVTSSVRSPLLGVLCLVVPLWEANGSRGTKNLGMSAQCSRPVEITRLHGHVTGGVDHRVGHGDHAAKRQHPHASCASGPLERGL
jgi:hypothetical protein